MAIIQIPEFWKDFSTSTVWLARIDGFETWRTEFSPEGFKQAALRETQSVAAAFSDKKLADMKTMLANFEAAFPDWVGRWKIVDAEEAQKV